MFGKFRSFLIKERDGVAAIEFGLLAPSFFLLMIAIFEISYVVYMTNATQRAVEQAVYDLRTGHVFTVINEEDIDVETWYKNTLCQRISLPNCSNSVAVRVEQFDMSGASIWNSEDAGALSAGASESLMRVEVDFTLPSIIFTGMVFGESAQTMKTGLTFMTEPY